jgi:hypothetical protein
MQKWRPHNRNVLCWWFFYLNDNAKVTFDTPQIMCYMLCYFDNVFSFNPRTKLRKGLIYYYIKSENFKIFEFFWRGSQLCNEKKFKEAFLKNEWQIYQVCPFMAFFASII